MSRAAFPLASLAIVVALAGCASSSGIAPEGRVLDAQTLLADKPLATYADWPANDWWTAFKDPVLDGLIAQALADNPNLQTAAARLRRATAAADQAESAQGPRLDATTNNSRERFSEYGLMPPPYAGTVRNVNEAQLDGRWEIDFFGRNAAILKASIGEMRASDAEYQAARQLVASNVARAYYRLAHLRAVHDVTVQLARQRAELGALTERRVAAGIDTHVELESARGVIAENARDLSSVDEQIAAARHALSALLGRAPDAAAQLAPSLPAVAALSLPAALPADLLGHRADVTAARWRVEASLHGLDAAQAAFYPNVNLRAFAGLSAIGFDNWLDAGSRHPGVGLAISLPIFDSGRLRNAYRVSAAGVDSAVGSYNATLIDALRDVADQLATLGALETQIARQNAALAAAQRNYALAQKRYRAEITDRLALLNVESRLIAQQRQAVDLQARWIDGRIGLIRALGGGFADDTAPAEARLAQAAAPQARP